MYRKPDIVTTMKVKNATVHCTLGCPACNDEVSNSKSLACCWSARRTRRSSLRLIHVGGLCLVRNPLIRVLLAVNFFRAYWLRDAPTGLTFNNCTFCPHCIYVFCIYLGTNGDLCQLQHKLIGFYNRDEKCLQRGTDWVFK